MVKLEKITDDNVGELLELNVAENQKDFVASKRYYKFLMKSDKCRTVKLIIVTHNMNLIIL